MGRSNKNLMSKIRCGRASLQVTVRNSSEELVGGKAKRIEPVSTLFAEATALSIQSFLTFARYRELHRALDRAFLSLPNSITETHAIILKS
ncbi:unnamed protein product, partial [Ilex paraguariensis]